jgi:hypothetical protein
MKNRNQKFGIAAIALAATATLSHAAPTVELNGQPLQTSVSPLIMNGRTLVPMRDIFEALGAKVNYNALTRGISATRATSTVNLQLGNKAATVNGQTVYLEQAPMTISGSTLVPLRFVSEAMGARVSYNAPTQLVSISQSGSSVAGTRTISIPFGRRRSCWPRRRAFFGHCQSRRHLHGDRALESSGRQRISRRHAYRRRRDAGDAENRPAPARSASTSARRFCPTARAFRCVAL